MFTSHEINTVIRFALKMSPHLKRYKCAVFRQRASLEVINGVVYSVMTADMQHLRL